MRTVSILTFVVGSLGYGLIAAGADDGARADHANRAPRVTGADHATGADDGTSTVPASYDDPSIGQLTKTTRQPHAQIINAPQASGPVHEQTQSLLDHQPMRASVQEHHDAPNHPTLWQRFTGRTRSIFSRATSALSPKPKPDSVTESRFTTVGQPDATASLPQSSAQKNSSANQNTSLWSRRSSGASK